MPFAYERLVEHLRDGSLIAFIGAGVSRAYQDPSGRAWTGLPTGGEIVQILCSRRDYILTDATFPVACRIIKEREGRAELERILTDILDRPTIEPLPAHIVLANLPFAAFLTTNLDQLLERALSEENRKPFPLIEDYDVSRLRPSHVPVIKVHGCVSRPRTIVAAEGEDVPLETKAPILEALIRVQLANRVVLFLGYALSDPDFHALYSAIGRSLGDHVPRSYAVVDRLPDSEESWAKHIEVVEHDLTDFLRGLLRASAESEHPAVYHPSEDWINNAFFESLHKIRTLPSETQVLDAFLKHLLEELRAPSLPFSDVLNRASSAVAMLLERRPNYEAFRKIAGPLVASLRSECQTTENAELKVREVIDARTNIEREIRRKGANLIVRSDRILVFSQSLRALQFLSGPAHGTQATCKLYVCECRPKSPAPFQDALSIGEHLKNLRYEVTIIPDAAIGNVIERGQVNKVIVGAHAVYVENHRPSAFVNTCGTVMLVSTAAAHRIPIFVVAERTKIAEVDPTVGIPPVSYQEEESLFESVSASVSDLRASGLRINVLNVGYDLVRFEQGVELVTDD